MLIVEPMISVVNEFRKREERGRGAAFRIKLDPGDPERMFDNHDFSLNFAVQLL